MSSAFGKCEMEKNGITVNNFVIKSIATHCVEHSVATTAAAASCSKDRIVFQLKYGSVFQSSVNESNGDMLDDNMHRLKTAWNMFSCFGVFAWKPISIVKLQFDDISEHRSESCNRRCKRTTTLNSMNTYSPNTELTDFYSMRWDEMLSWKLWRKIVSKMLTWIWHGLQSIQQNETIRQFRHKMPVSKFVPFPRIIPFITVHSRLLESQQNNEEIAMQH